MKQAVVLAPGLGLVNNQAGSPEIPYQQLAQLLRSGHKQAYQPDADWRYLTRGWLPLQSKALTELTSFVREYRQKQPLARILMVAPVSRQAYFARLHKTIAERLAGHSPELVDWSAADRRWSGLMAGLAPGDIFLVDTTVASGRRQLKKIEKTAPNGVRWMAWSDLFADLVGLGGRLPQSALVSAHKKDWRHLQQAGLPLAQGIVDQLPGQRFDLLAREIELQNPPYLLVVEPAADGTTAEHWQTDDHLTKVMTLLGDHGYVTHLIGAPERRPIVTSQNWPYVEWQNTSTKGLPPGWHHEILTADQAKRRAWNHLGVAG